MYNPVEDKPRHSSLAQQDLKLYTSNYTMLGPTYFLVNHSRKEFWCFDNKNPLLDILNVAIKNIKDWKLTDEICIDSECSCYGKMLHLITDKGYKEIVF